MTTTISLHKFLKGANPVADHRPWPRVVVDEARWLALREQLATSDWALLGLWGDRSAAGSLSVHVALRDETEEVADGIAVVTLSAFPAAPAAETYQAWVRHGATWTSLGTVAPDPDGSARLIAEDPALAALPDGLEVTLEPGNGSASPSERVIVAWTP